MDSVLKMVFILSKGIFEWLSIFRLIEYKFVIIKMLESKVLILKWVCIRLVSILVVVFVRIVMGMIVYIGYFCVNRIVVIVVFKV